MKNTIKEKKKYIIIHVKKAKWLMKEKEYQEEERKLKVMNELKSKMV